MLPKILELFDGLHLEHPHKGGYGKDDAENEFKEGYDRVGVLIFELQIENLELLLNTKIFGLELCQFILDLSITSPFTKKASFLIFRIALI